MQVVRSNYSRDSRIGNARPKCPRNFCVPSRAIPARTNWRHTVSTSHGITFKTSAITANGTRSSLESCSRTASVRDSISSISTLPLSMSPRGPNRLILLRHIIKWHSHPVSRHTEGNKLSPVFALWYRRQAGPARGSKLIGSSSPHPHGQESKSHRGPCRSTMTASPGCLR